MLITIYQIMPELDTDRIKFMDLDFMKRHGYETPPADLYKAVYHGDVDAQNLEEIFRLFNRVTEADTRYLESIGFCGHSLSVSDVVEIFISAQNSRFYFCNMLGFQEISFDKRLCKKHTSPKGDHIRKKG